MRKCFVITPFGNKEIRLKNNPTPQTIDFDQIYKKMISPGIVAARLNPERANETFMTGIITNDMFENIFDFDAAVADISIPNPNVFYELGVRHALRKYCTLLIRHADAEPMSEWGDAPFDLSNIRFISYRLDDDSTKAAAAQITTFLGTSLAGKRPDSPVYHALPSLNVERRGRPLPDGRVERYRFRLTQRNGFFVGVVAGALQNVYNIDAWVNSENTQFEMARVFERSVSSTIRYLGSTKLRREGYEELGDEIYKELRKRKTKLVGNRTHVKSGTVALTSSYELFNPPHCVKRIAHVASVTGRNMDGFEPVDDRRQCILNILTAISRHNRRVLSGLPWTDKKVRSVLIPLLGGGQAKGNPKIIVDEMISATLEYLRDARDTGLREIYFLAYLDSERDLLLRALENYPEIERVS